MFPNLPGIAGDDRYLDPERATGRETRSASRLEAQRQLLKDDTMYHLHSMSVEQHEMERDRDLARRQMIALAQGERTSLISKLRQSFGDALISIGERIRPPFGPGEPTYNG